MNLLKDVKKIALLAVFFSVISVLGALYASPKAHSISYKSFAHRVNNNRQIGNPDAGVTVIIYADFQCEWCRKFDEKDLPLIIKNYVKTGKIFISFRDFPLTLIHKYAFKGAEYADCAAAQGKYFPVRNLLYKNQKNWSALGDLYYFLKTRAGGIIDLKKEESCVRSGLAKELVKNNSKSGAAAGVVGTPTLFIYKGLILYKKITGYRRYPVLKKILDDASK